MPAPSPPIRPLPAYDTRFPPLSTTSSPSSFLNSPRWGTGSKSSTASEGRHSLTPSGVTTIGRLIKNWMRHHGIEELFVGNRWIIQAQVAIWRPLYTDQLANGDAHACDERLQQRAARRAFQIFDDMRLNAGISDQPKHISRRPAFRIVIDDYVDHLQVPVALSENVDLHFY